MVLKLFSQVLRNTRYTVTIFNNSFSNERDYECLNLWCQILFAFRHKTTCYLTALNNIRAQLKSILIDLRARNFVQVKTSLCARCMQARHHIRNLSSPDDNCTDTSDLSKWGFWRCFVKKEVKSKYKQSNFVQHLKKYGGFSKHTLILYCKKHFGKAAQIVF